MVGRPSKDRLSKDQDLCAPVRDCKVCSAVAEAITARESAIKSALDLLAAERSLDADTRTAALMDAEDRLALAARSLTRAVDGCPASRQPRGWRDA